MSAPPNFNRLAPLYRWMEYSTLGPFLARARSTYLPQTTTARNALILGDGDGRFTARLLRTNPHIHIDAVDASPSMLAALVRRAGPHAARVRIHHADARTLLPPSPLYDLLITHFFLDCLTTAEVASLAATLRAAAAPQALWLLSEFAIPPSLYGRLIAAPLVHSLYRAFALLTALRIRTLPDHHTALLQSGFTLQQRRPRLAGLLITELWSATSTHS